MPENHNDHKPQQQKPQTPESGLRRYTEISRPPEQYSPSLCYVFLIDFSEPEIYEEAMKVETRKKWEKAMEEEMDSLMHKQTWDLVKFPIGKTKLQNKWVYMFKEEYGGK